MYFWQLWWLFAFNLLLHSARILQLHLALSRLIFRSIRWMLHHSWTTWRWGHFRLIWHYICREDSLLCLFSFDFKSGERAELVILSPRCMSLARTNFLISVMIHAHVHLILVHLWAVWPSGVATMDLNGVYRSQHTLLELGALVYLLLSVLWSHNAGWTCRIYEVARLNRIKLKIRGPHVRVFIDFRQFVTLIPSASIATNVLQLWHPGSFTCLLPTTRTFHSIHIVPARIVQMTVDHLIAYLSIDVGHSIIWFHSAATVVLCSRFILLWMIHILKSVFVEVYRLWSIGLRRCLLITVGIPRSAHYLERISFESLSDFLSCK